VIRSAREDELELLIESEREAERIPGDAPRVAMRRNRMVTPV
jgi:hypothetical protein